jgi:predicted flap endonuclease-1-like 5' DNA nuclease
VPLDAIVEPAPVIESVESDALPPETALLEHVQLETPDNKPSITIVDVEQDETLPTEPMFARQPVAEIEAAAEKVASDIKENADQIQAMLRTESAARAVEAHAGRQSRQVITEMSKTVPEIAASVFNFAMRAFRSTAEKIEGRLKESPDLAAFGEKVKQTVQNTTSSAVASVDERVADTQTRSDAIASWVGQDDAAKASGDTPGENINLSEDANPVVEGFPKSEESEFTGMADDLTRLEGIGPKMASALNAAGIVTFAQLSQASDDELRDAIQTAGMRLAPTLSTWSQQAAYAQRGDWEGLKDFQQRISQRRSD